MGVVPGVGVCVWLGVGVPDGDGLAVCVGLAERFGVRDDVGTGDGLVVGAEVGGAVGPGSCFVGRVC